MKTNNIYRTIYQQEGIARHLQRQWWAAVCAIVGLVCGYFFLRYPDASSGLSSLLLGLSTLGAFALATILCYLLFGDKYLPYHKSTCLTLEPTELYYPASVRDKLVEALQKKDSEALGRIKTSSVPQIILVQFSDDACKVCYSQLLDATTQEPLTEIFVRQ